MMRLAVLLTLSGSLATGVLAQGTFEAPFRIKSGVEFIDVNTGHAAPYLFDFDGDGVRDLLVGEFGKGSMKFEGETFSRGRLRIYRNVGSESDPKYDGFTWFMAGGEIAQVPITCCVSFCPEPVDWDADGDIDLLTGSYPGHLYLYRNNGDGTYAKAELVRDQHGGFVKPAYSTNVRTHDWDGDGDLDLVIATSSSVYLVRNIGTRAVPSFDAGAEKIMYQGKPISMRGRLGVELADWNGDGRIDMLLGLESAGVLVLYNSAQEGEPSFEESEVLIRTDRDEMIGGRLKMHVVDYNGDGRDDLIVGDVNWSKDSGPRETLTEDERREYDEFVRRTESASQEIARLVVERDLKLDRSVAREIQSRIGDLLDERGDDYYEKRAKYEQNNTGDTHGYVWVFLRTGTVGNARSAFEDYRASGSQQLKVRLGSESKTIQPGEPFRLGLLFEIAEGCYTYSGVAGSSPMPTTLDVQLPDGFKVTNTHWPEPKAKASQTDGDTTAGTYSSDFVVTLTVEPPAALVESSYTIRVISNWQSCRDAVCRLGESYNSLALITGAAKPTAVADWLAPPEQQ